MREERQGTLSHHGLVETPDGFALTLAGFQKASQRALDLRRQGDQEAIRMLALPSDDPLRWEYCRCLQIDSFTAEAHQAGI
ncbi:MULTISPECIES: hypothetical protein [unclassified Streptomyces]|uniref:hypothetical protein n=1 Tax=unclassified Streptomyces TaxID=2593676 RepID=UPI0037009F64